MEKGIIEPVDEKQAILWYVSEINEILQDKTYNKFESINKTSLEIAMVIVKLWEKKDFGNKGS